MVSGKSEECTEADRTAFLSRFRKAIASVPGGLAHSAAKYVCSDPNSAKKVRKSVDFSFLDSSLCR